ncbi:transglutaminase family protein [Frankia gtarii]|uniref:transglutaminase family protein n=2 Tax=Frankia gtarii TaxID=2950102 RepID=UPI0021C14BFE|nr:transglutaminase family protein [Frankia gtarii]
MSDSLDPSGSATLPPPSTAAGAGPSTDRGPEPAAISLTDLPAGTRVTYRVAQRFRYTYDGDATDLVHRLVVVPPSRHGDQVVRDDRLTVSADAARTTWLRGADGTRTAVVRLDQVPPRLDFDVTVTIDRIAGGARPWLRATALAGRRLLDPTPLTAPDAALTAAARALATDDPVATARRFCGWVHSRIRYVPGSTEVATTAAQALAGGSGVCQDQAHVMLALCRAAGLPARYVSGHLVGDGPSHAWVEVIMAGGAAQGVPRTGAGGGAAPGTDRGEPGAFAVAYDPCHDRLADLRYVTIAVGRDYSEVAPTSGWYTGQGRGTLTARQQVTVVDVQPVQ